jgi:hypothetical protein
MVAKRHKITNVPLFKKIWDIIFFFWDNNFLSHFSGHFEGAKIMSRIFLNSGTLIVIMSFCRILSTLYSEVIFHNVPHFSRGRQKSGTKSTA